MSTKTTITAEEFAETGSDTDGFELVRGELVPMPPPSEEHGIVSANIAFLLKAYTRMRGQGVVLSNDSGLLTGSEPDTVRGVDVMLYLQRAKGANGAKRRYPNQPPDLAVEVRSPSQSWKDLMDKVLEYLNMGVRMVWVVEPTEKRITIYTPDKEPEALTEEREIDGGAVLPGFRCGVWEVFEGL